MLLNKNIICIKVCKIFICTPQDKSAEEIAEDDLLENVRNILKHQVVPMEFMKLRKLVKESPQHLKLYQFIQNKYPGEEFLDFLKKYPNHFLINPNKTVQSYEASFCLLPPPSKKTEVTCDEVDSFDKREYISDEESSNSEEMHSDSDT